MEVVMGLWPAINGGERGVEPRFGVRGCVVLSL